MLVPGLCSPEGAGVGAGVGAGFRGAIVGSRARRPAPGAGFSPVFLLSR